MSEEHVRSFLAAFRESSGDSNKLMRSLERQSLLADLPNLLRQDSVKQALIKAYEGVHGTTQAQQSEQYKHLKLYAFIVTIILEAVKMEFHGSKSEETRLIRELQEIIDEIQEGDAV